MNYEDQKIVDVDIEKEMTTSFMEYAMSVIVSRALPDVRDGLKPVHRRILYTMYEDGLFYNRPFRKSATAVGDVLGRYHPHGDSSVYDALVRLAQDFSLRYPLVDGHGNFGSVDGDPPAAYRYTEARLSRMAGDMLTDIEKETVDFKPNFDELHQEPVVLPSRFPNLLVNGSMGIAVGMATNIPPHNLSEVVDGIVEVIDNPEATLDDVMKHIKGPDFPTGGTIMGRSGIRAAYYTGRGRIKVRSCCEIEEGKDGRTRIIVREIPYMVNKSRLVSGIADLVNDKTIEGIADIHDESSDRVGIQVVIKLKKDANAQVVLNQLYKHSQLEDSFSVIMLALVDNQPRILNLRDIIDQYIRFQEDVIRRRTQYDLRKAKERCHILEGLKIACDNIDEVIHIIRTSYDEAKERLMERFELSAIQAQAILDMRLGRLQGLEVDKIMAELKELQQLIEQLTAVLADENKVLQIVRQELLELKEKYGDERRTQISLIDNEIDIEDLIEEEECVYTMTHQGYIKRLPVSTYKAQRRGGRGITGMTTKEEDFIEEMFTASTHNYLLFFTTKGRMFRLKGYEVPESSRTAKGTNIVNLLQLDPEEKITSMISVKEFSEGDYLMMVTKNGTVKKTALDEVNSSRKGGIIVISLDEGDELIGVKKTGGDNEIVIGSHDGKAIRFHEKDVRPMGRSARGVRGILLEEDDYIVGVSMVRHPEASLLTITEKGYGKRTSLHEYKLQLRGGKGVTNYNITEKTGKVVGIKVVDDNDDAILISSDGIIIRFSASDVSQFGRIAQGVILMRLSEEEKVVTLARTVREEDEGEEEISAQPVEESVDSVE
ncbi:MAG: DNA gyrase subunit A [Eubacteriales bacterium]|jgi:DNA gyrase subunit A